MHRSSMCKRVLPALFLLLMAISSTAQQQQPAVIGYYAGSAERLAQYPVGKLTHLIFSFGRLVGNRLEIVNAGDTACIRKMVSYKQQYPGLRVLLSVGGWGGCSACSSVFGTEDGRTEFAQSVKALSEYFHTDGIDLDWEYPAIAGYPGHAFAPEDKEHFSLLVEKLREVLGNKYQITFAAGGFDHFIGHSVDWKRVMRTADLVNVMTYDLVHGASDTSGHHTPLYSTAFQKQSTNNAVESLIAHGVPARKIVIGAAFYGRLFAIHAETVRNHGLYEPAHFDHGFSFARLEDTISAANGFTRYWDDAAQAPYAYNPARKLLASYDDSTSIRLKTQYAIRRGLGGIMFWQLADDKTSSGLLDVIYRTKLAATKKR